MALSAPDAVSPIDALPPSDGAVSAVVREDVEA